MIIKTLFLNNRTKILINKWMMTRTNRHSPKNRRKVVQSITRPRVTVLPVVSKEEVIEQRITAVGPANKEEHKMFISKRCVFDSKTLPNGIEKEKDATFFVQKLLPGERKMLFDSLRKKTVDQYQEHKRLGNAEVHVDDMRKIWYIYFICYFIYGTCDNAFLILLEEEIDEHFGVVLGISIMAAAALSNIVVNLMGIGIPDGVERTMRRMGLRRPVLSAEQWVNRKVRFIVIFAKIVGVLLGCTCGMFPLLFIDYSGRENGLEVIDINNEDVEGEERENDMTKTIRSKKTIETRDNRNEESREKEMDNDRMERSEE